MSFDWSKSYKNPIGDLRRGINSANTAGSMKEAFQKGQVQQAQLEQSQALLQKALPIMENILLQRMIDKRPITLVRSLAYTTEAMQGQEQPEEEDDGFYAIKKSNPNQSFNAKFVSIKRTLPAGTVLTFVTLEKSMGQMWFKTEKGQDVGIYVDEKIGLLTQSDIGDLVYKHLTEE